MKIANLHLENFKKFRHKTFDFTDESGKAKDILVIIGKNGSGKSTVLQAIAAMLASATRLSVKPEDLEWPGLDWELVDSAWPAPPKIELNVEFSLDEIDATQEYFKKTRRSQERTNAVVPANSAYVKLTLDPTTQKVMAPTGAEYFQFHGRGYASSIFKYEENSHILFNRVGSVFWYTEQRTTNSFVPEENLNGHQALFDLNILRRSLNSRMDFHQKIESGQWQLKAGQRDIYAHLSQAYKAVFPDRSFYGSVPRFEPGSALAEPWFYLYDGKNTYELSEMSGAERAIFPMLYDFANWSIHNSVILIDEIELHLHPPLQQALIRALPKLGKNNQFIITTHSEAITNIVPADSIVYL